MYRPTFASRCLAQGLGSIRTLSSTSKSKVVLGGLQRGIRSSLVFRPHIRATNNNYWRTLSSKESGEKKGESKAEDGSDETQLVLTPGQKVVAFSRLGLWGGLGVFALCCAYYIGRELFPTKMSPNRIFDNAFDVVRNDHEVKRRYGHPIKGYGRDHGGKREGRRNFIEHTERVDQEDGSNRTRVRFNIEGPYGGAFVFAEVSSAMSSGEFVYVLVQDKANGRVQTVVDNRSALTASRLAGGNKDSMAAMSQLLGGGKRSD